MSKSKFPETLNDFFKVDRSADAAISDWGPSLTRQEFADEADINVLMSRYERTGVPPAVNGVEPVYMDLTAMPVDLQAMMDTVLTAEKAFMQLPANVRREFDNNPVEFVQYASDPENVEQMRSWGLAKPVKVPDPPQRVEVVNAPPVGGAPQDAPKAS